MASYGVTVGIGDVDRVVDGGVVELDLDGALVVVVPVDGLDQAHAVPNHESGGEPHGGRPRLEGLLDIDL